MNRLVTVLIVFSLSVTVMAQKSSIITDILIQSVELKVSSAQNIIEFDNAKAEQLKRLEIDYLLNVQKVEKCFLCGKKKKLEALKLKRDNDLENVLERDQYIKYMSLESNLIKNIPVHI